MLLPSVAARALCTHGDRPPCRPPHPTLSRTCVARALQKLTQLPFIGRLLVEAVANRANRDIPRAKEDFSGSLCVVVLAFWQHVYLGFKGNRHEEACGVSRRP